MRINPEEMSRIVIILSHAQDGVFGRQDTVGYAGLKRSHRVVYLFIALYFQEKGSKSSHKVLA